MADLYQVKFRGATLWTASDGEQKFKRGLFRRRVVLDDVIGGAVIKDGCRGTAKHTLTLEYHTTSKNASTIEAAVYAKLQAIWDGVPGTLEIPEVVALPNCVVIDIDLSEQTRVVQASPLNSASTSFVEGVAIVATIQFEQTA